MRHLLIALPTVILAAGLTAGGFWLDRQLADGNAPPRASSQPRPPITLEGRVIADGDDVAAVVHEVSESLLSRPVTLTHEKRPVTTVTLRDVGATVDTATTIARIEALRSTPVAAPSSAARASEPTALWLDIQVPADTLIDRLIDFKEVTDRAPVGAKRRINRSLGLDQTIDHVDGAYLDVYSAVENLLRAARAAQPGEPTAPTTVEIPSFKWAPRATREVVSAIDIGAPIGTFQTRFGGPPGRDQNIFRGTNSLDGVVIMPGESISFNEIVGPRSEENGFFPAPEIYKGEMRMGIGGGSCQVASTLYAAAFFGGLEIVERRNHSRPSGYIRIGLDATVSYPTLDLRIKNPFDFPVIVSATADKGTLSFDLLGQARQVDVTFETETKSILKFSRKIQRAAYLPAGEYRVKQRGKRGVSIKRRKTVHYLASGETRLEESTDVYPPTQEIFLVSPGVGEKDLPPLEPEPGSQAAASAADASSTTSDSQATGPLSSTSPPS